MAEFGKTLEEILLLNSSVNMYMFIGGTSFAFMAGANVGGSWPYYTPDTTSYVDHPEKPPEREKVAYDKVSVAEYLKFPTLVSQQWFVQVSEGPLSMEQLPSNDLNGQSYGYVSYTTHANLTPTSKLLITNHVRDLAQVLVDGIVKTKPYSAPDDISGFGFWNGKDQELDIPGSDQVAEVTILVENLARVNFGNPGDFNQKKGIWEGSVFIDGLQIDEWIIHSLEMKGREVTNYTGWQPFEGAIETPAMYRGTFEITAEPKDTFLDMSGWNKGVVFINGFNVGKYWKEGPPTTLYIPGPLLQTGSNEIIAFEQYTPGHDFTFSALPILG